MTPELAPSLITTIPHQREDVSALDRFNVHRCPTRRVFSGTELELVTRSPILREQYNADRFIQEVKPLHAPFPNSLETSSTSPYTLSGFVSSPRVLELVSYSFIAF
ncbi:uncharacterized protein TNCV_4261811 [Trichonephila clavipes]|nr:uncharacterized protein TNCV_4261811 [Trichonephila clavipes]